MTTPAATATNANATPRLEGDELVSSLKKQLEFYFSAENLANDAFLVSQMNAQKWVQIDVIANFRKVRTLTEDREVLVRVMRQCKNILVDDANTMVRPNVKNERNTLFLRDIPATTPEADIRAIFADEKVGGKVVSVRADTHADMWFVTFESEDACTNWALELTSRTFQGKPIRSGVKSENMLRGFYYPGAKQESGAPAGNQSSGAPAGRTNHRGQQPAAPANAFFPPSSTATAAPTAAPASSSSSAATTSTAATTTTTYVPNWQPGFNKPADGDFYGRNGAARGAPANTTTNAAAATPASPGTPGSKRNKANKAAKKSAGGNGNGNGAPLGKDNWPALPKKELSVGYSADFAHYDKTKLAEIFASMVAKGALTRPASMPSPSECVAVRSTGVTSVQLMDAMPVFFPASPSPVIAAQTAPFQSNMPFLDLSNTEAPTSIPAAAVPVASPPAAAAASSAKQPLSSLVGKQAAPAKAANVAAKKKPTAVAATPAVTASAVATPAAATATAPVTTTAPAPAVTSPATNDATRGGRGNRGAARGGRGGATSRGGRPASATAPPTDVVATPVGKGGKRVAAKKPVAATAAVQAAPAKVAPNPQSWSAKAAGTAGGVAPKPVAKVAAKQAAPAPAAAVAATPAAAAPVATSTPANTSATTSAAVPAAGGKLSYAEMARRAAAEAAAKSS